MNLFILNSIKLSQMSSPEHKTPIYHYSLFTITTEKNISCSICLEEITEDSQTVIVKTTCNHLFHSVCLQTWLLLKSSCPYCRNNIVT
jgi:protein-disulfide isomerase